MSELVCIKTFLNRYEAEIAKGLLESRGIEVILSADDAGGMQPQLTFTRGVRLIVKEEEAEAALKILEEQEEGREEE